MYKKRWAGLLGICLMLMLVVLPFVSCCSDPNSGTYTVGITNFPKTNNPFGADVGGGDAPHMAMLYEPLIWGIADGGDVPGLAETWTYDQASMTWTINIYDDATWSDGEPVTAADAKFTIEKFIEIGHGSVELLKDYMDTITAVDDKTLTFEMNAAFALFVGEIQTVPIAPEHIWGDMTNIEVMDETNNDPIGSGAFRLVEMETDSHVIYEAREDYWGGTFDVDTVIKKFYGTSEAQKLALQVGDIDAPSSLGMISAVPELDADPNIATYTYQVNQTLTFYVNHRYEPWNLSEFRNAVSMGIDRQSLVDYAADGFAVMPNLIEVAPFISHAADGIEWPYADMTQQARIDMANDALDDIDDMTTIAGGAGGIRKYKGELLQFEFLCTESPTNVSCAEIVAENCEDMGISMQIATQSAATLVGTVYRQVSDATEMGWETHIWSRPFAVEYDWLCDNYGYDDPFVVNYRGWIIGWRNEEVQDMFDEILALAPGAARDALTEESQLLMAEDLPVIPLYHSVSASAYRTDRFTGQIDGPGFSTYGAVPGPGSPMWIMALKSK